MSEPIVFYDLEFIFTHGLPAGCTVQEGRDHIRDINACPHCGAAEAVKVTVVHEDGSETTLTVHRDKLNAVQSTKRVVKPEPRDSILELD